jgi:hypothetical protein
VSQYLGKGQAAPGTTSPIKPGDVVAVDTDGIRLRETAGLDGRWIDTLYTDEEAVVIGGPTSVDGYDWLQLRQGGVEGWGAATYLRRVGKAWIGAGHRARVIEGELNLRSGAGTSNPVIAILADGSYVDVLENPRSANGYEWVRVSSSRFGSGWCVTRYLVRA